MPFTQRYVYPNNDRLGLESNRSLGTKTMKPDKAHRSASSTTLASIPATFVGPPPTATSFNTSEASGSFVNPIATPCQGCYECRVHKRNLRQAQDAPEPWKQISQETGQEEIHASREPEILERQGNGTHVAEQIGPKRFPIDGGSFTFDSVKERKKRKRDVIRSAILHLCRKRNREDNLKSDDDDDDGDDDKSSNVTIHSSDAKDEEREQKVNSFFKGLAKKLCRRGLCSHEQNGRLQRSIRFYF